MDTAQASCSISENATLVPNDRQDSSPAVTRRSKAKSPRRLASPVSERYLTPVIQTQSVSVTKDPSANVSNIVDESYTSNSVSPQLPVGSLPAVGERTPSKQTKVTSCRTRQGVKYLRNKDSTRDTGSETHNVLSVSDFSRQSTSPDKTSKGYTSSDVFEYRSDGHEAPSMLKGQCRQAPQDAEWCCVLKKTSRSDAESETQADPSVPDLARYMTSPDKGCTSSDVCEPHFGRHESPRSLRSHRRGKRDDVTSEVEASLTDSDYSPVFPMPPQITRSCTSLEFLKTDGGKGDSQVAGQPRKISDVQDGIEKVSDKQPARNSENVAFDEPEKPLGSRLRSRSSESKSGAEADGVKVQDTATEKPLKPTRSKVMPVIAVGEERSDVLEDRPVSSRLRRQSCGKSEADDTAQSQAIRSTDTAELHAASSPAKSDLCPSSTQSPDSSRGLELTSQAECSPMKQSSSATADPPLISGNVCRISDDTSFLIATETELSPKSNPSSAENVQPKRASFQLKVNLKSPKAERIKRLASSSSEDTDDVSRSMSPAWPPTQRGRRSLTSTLSRSEEHQSPPGSDRKLRPRLRRSLRIQHTQHSPDRYCN